MRASLGTILDFYPESSNLKLRFDKTSSLTFRSWGRRALASGQSQAYKAGEHLATRSLLKHNSMSTQFDDQHETAFSSFRPDRMYFP